jgi:hypothetical protein
MNAAPSIPDTSEKRAPIWQRTPCPPWCGGGHLDSDHRTEREHFGGYHTIALSHAQALQVGTTDDPRWILDEVRVSLVQGYREAMPWLSMGFGSGMKDDYDTGEIDATLDEGEELAALIFGLIAAARPYDGDVRRLGTPVEQDAPARPWAIWMTAPCPPWCTTTHHDADAGHARHCATTEQHVNLTLPAALTSNGEWFLSSVHVTLEANHREAEPRIVVCLENSGFELTLDEASEWAHHMLDLVTMGRPDAFDMAFLQRVDAVTDGGAVCGKADAR